MFDLPQSVLKAIDILESNQYEAYIVGGAVRDYILNRIPHDYDLVTNAKIDELCDIFKGYKIVKYKKGFTIGVVIEHFYIEISSFVGNSIYEDLENRDFTINALAYRNGKIIDLFNSKNDILNKTIKAVADISKDIQSDPLRMLRAIRFKAVLGFEIDDNLNSYIHTNCKLLRLVNKERIKDELNEILVIEKPSKILREFSDVFSYIIPNIKDMIGFNQNTRWHNLDVFEHTLKVVDNCKPDLVLRLAALFHDIGKPYCYSVDELGNGHFYGHYLKSKEICESWLKEYKYSKIMINRILKLVYYHDRAIEDNDKSVLGFLRDFNKNDLDLYFSLRKADIIGQNPSLLYRINDMVEIEKRCYNLANSNIPFKVSDLKIKGNTIISYGFNNEEVNNLLNEILDLVISGDLINDKYELKKYVEEKSRSK